MDSLASVQWSTETARKSKFSAICDQFIAWKQVLASAEISIDSTVKFLGSLELEGADRVPWEVPK